MSKKRALSKQEVYPKGARARKKEHPQRNHKASYAPFLSPLRKELLEFLIQPFHILFALAWSASPVAPDTREHL